MGVPRAPERVSRIAYLDAAQLLSAELRLGRVGHLGGVKNVSFKASRSEPFRKKEPRFSARAESNF
jgi:hypothetical protein